MPEDVAIIGQCLECETFIFEDDQYEDLGDDYFIHADCLPEDGPSEHAHRSGYESPNCGACKEEEK